MCLQLLWKGAEAIEAALQLLEIASGHLAGSAAHTSTKGSSSASSDEDVSLATAEDEVVNGPISWPQPLLRPAANPKQARDFSRLRSSSHSTAPGAHPGLLLIPWIAVIHSAWHHSEDQRNVPTA
jgi:hypothetical protein